MSKIFGIVLAFVLEHGHELANKGKTRYLFQEFWEVGDTHRIHGTGIFNLREWLIFMVNVGKYTSPMDPIGYSHSSPPDNLVTQTNLIGFFIPDHDAHTTIWAAPPSHIFYGKFTSFSCDP